MAMTTLGDEDFELVRRLPLFAGLTADAARVLLSGAREQRQPRGLVLFLRDDPADRFYVILDGWVKLSRETVDGDEFVIGMFTRGESFAEAAIFGSGHFPVTAETVSPSRLLMVPAKPFVTAIGADPGLALNMLSSMSAHLRQLVQQVEQLQAKSAPQRVGAFLLRLSPDASGPITIQLPYDKSLIAARLGMKPETFSRALATLRRLGLRTEGTSIVVPEPVALQRYCEDARAA